MIFLTGSMVLNGLLFATSLFHWRQQKQIEETLKGDKFSFFHEGQAKFSRINQFSISHPSVSVTHLYPSPTWNELIRYEYCSSRFLSINLSHASFLSNYTISFQICFPLYTNDKHLLFKWSLDIYMFDQSPHWRAWVKSLRKRRIIGRNIFFTLTWMTHYLWFQCVHKTHLIIEWDRLHCFNEKNYKFWAILLKNTKLTNTHVLISLSFPRPSYYRLLSFYKMNKRSSLRSSFELISKW